MPKAVALSAQLSPKTLFTLCQKKKHLYSRAHFRASFIFKRPAAVAVASSGQLRLQFLSCQLRLQLL